jgi:hypothetical protein
VNSDARPTAKNLMIVELNEFDPSHLSKMADMMGLTHLRKVLSFNHSTTTTDDLQERQGLDPWVQWVGVHCGKPTEAHRIRRLGATRMQDLPQIWHAVAAQGYTWGVWGPMNAPMGDSTGACFFMPDPWSFDETAHPEYLNDLLALPRYIAQNYLKISYKEAFIGALRLARFFAPPSHWDLLARFGAHFTAGIATTGPNVHTFTTLIDYLSVLCFIKLRRKDRPNLSLIFLNHIAHLQHQFWLPDSKPHAEMALGLKLADAMIGLLLADRQNGEAFLMMNALKQMNVADKGFYVYRQIQPQEAVNALGITGGHVEQCMTHDATILFSDKESADNACAILEVCKLSDGYTAFQVERQSDTRVFYQLAFEHRVSSDTFMICGSSSWRFYDMFELVCERTGAHIPEGDVYCEGLTLPEHMHNHEIFQYLLQFFAHAPDRTPPSYSGKSTSQKKSLDLAA